MADAAAEPFAASGGDYPELDGGDVATYLTSAGIRPEMASALCNPPPPASASTTAAAAGGSRGGGGAGGRGAEAAAGERPYLAAWALLLSHLLSLPADGQASLLLKHVLREAQQVVHALLDRLVEHLPLLESGPQGRAASREGGAAAAERRRKAAAAAAAAAQAGPGAKAASLLADWQLGPALEECGLPNSRCVLAWPQASGRAGGPCVAGKAGITRWHEGVGPVAACLCAHRPTSTSAEG